MADSLLESQSLWYRYKTGVWLEESNQSAVVHNIMRVLRAFHYRGKMAYVSVPITSGRYLYNLRLEQPQLSKERQLEIAIWDNYRFGLKFVEELQHRTTHPILYPADLTPVHQQWEQAHFQALWLSIIAEKCTELHMSEGWEFSNGGSEEFTHVWQLKLGLPKHKDLVFYNTKESEESERERMKNIVVYNHKGELLSISDGINAIFRSREWLAEHNLVSEKLEHCFDILCKTKELLELGFYQ